MWANNLIRWRLHLNATVEHLRYRVKDPRATIYRHWREYRAMLMKRVAPRVVAMELAKLEERA